MSVESNRKFLDTFFMYYRERLELKSARILYRYEKINDCSLKDCYGYMLKHKIKNTINYTIIINSDKKMSLREFKSTIFHELLHVKFSLLHCTTSSHVRGKMARREENFIRCLERLI